MRIDVNMVPPEASACMLWGGMSSCGLSTKKIIAKIDSCSAVLRTYSVTGPHTACTLQLEDNASRDLLKVGLARGQIPTLVVCQVGSYKMPQGL